MNLVHWQQSHGEGITLQFPPTAYVSNLSQVPEETAHLFALVHQPSDLPALKRMSVQDARIFELRFMTLHECFAKLSSNLVTGKSILIPRSRKRSTFKVEDIWELAHREGYFLAQVLTQRFFDGHVSQDQLIQWFQLDWSLANGSVAMRRLYRLAQQTPISKHFL